MSLNGFGGRRDYVRVGNWIKSQNDRNIGGEWEVYNEMKNHIRRDSTSNQRCTNLWKT